MKILVTGGFGEVASGVVEKLVKEGYIVDVVDNLSTGIYENLSSRDVNIKHVPIFAIELFEQKYAELRKQDQVLFFEADFEEKILLERISAGYYDVVFHFASLTKDERILSNVAIAVDNNITRTFNLAKAIKNCDSTKLILATHLREDDSMFCLHKKFIQFHFAELGEDVLYLMYDSVFDIDLSLRSILKKINSKI